MQKTNLNGIVCEAKLSAISSLEDVAFLLKSSTGFILDVIKEPESHYRTFAFPKKKGGERRITAPEKRVRDIQRQLKDCLDEGISWPAYLHGGIKNKSIVTNAKSHLNKPFLLNMDIKDFFPSILEKNVQEILLKFGAKPNVATVLAALCCYKGCLPQGAPTSTFFANLAFSSVDIEIRSIIRRGRFVYSRYVDDISISGTPKLISFRGHIERTIAQKGYKISLMESFKQGQCQVVTGLVVNKKLRPTNQFINDLEDDIRACLDRDFGSEVLAAMQGMSVYKLKLSLRGKINHLRNFQPEKAEKLSSLLAKIK